MKKIDTKSKNLIIPFILFTYLISWTIWAAIIVAMKYGAIGYGSPIMMLFHGAAICAPAISTILLLLKSKQMSGKELLRNIFSYKQPLLIYFLVIGIAFLVYFIPLVLNRATIIQPLYLIPLSIPLEIIGGGFEEIGWRFLLQPALEKKTNFILSTIITAIVWAVWHLPLFFMEGTNQYSWNFGIFTVMVFGIAFMLSTIYKIRKSVFLCILFHTMYNAIGDSIALDMKLGTITLISSILIVLSFLIIKKYCIKTQSYV